MVINLNYKKSRHNTLRCKNHTSHDCKYIHGFSLLELLVTLAIVGIVAAIAFPSYQNSVRKSNRSDGEALLLGIKAKMEMNLYSKGTFTDDLTGLNYVSASSIPSVEDYYLASVLSPTASCPINSCYVLRATPQGGQVKDGILELTSTGIYRRDKNGDGDATDTDEEGWK